MQSNGKSIAGVLADIARTLAAYVRGQLRIAFWMIWIYAAGFALLKVPLWGLVAVVCGSLHLVPMLGTVLGLVIPVGASLLVKRDPYQILGIIGVFAAAQAIEGFYLTPRILGSHLRLRPVIVFLALLVGGLLFGFFGALFAVPGVAVAMLIWRALQGRSERSP